MSGKVELPGEVGIPLLVTILWLLMKGGGFLMEKLAGDRGKSSNQKPRGEGSKHHLFGINFQMRRRKLDITRKDSSFSLSIGEKIMRQSRWLFGKRKRRR